MARDPSRTAAAFSSLVETVARLRRDCPWDREQTPRSIMPFLIEEAYEVLEALESGEATEICGELGDLLLQILLHSEMASESGAFDVCDVIEAVRDKMVRRHPHVFGDLAVGGTGEVLANWSRIKAEERRTRNQDVSALAGVPSALPALLRAERLGEKAGRVGFDWSEARAVLDKVREELAELAAALDGGTAQEIDAELGDCLFALASLGRKAGVSAELALTRALERFVARFRRVEAELARRGRSPDAASLEEMEALWQEAKRR
ncbi:MAG: nucleoside triphosphate pyrophosphohydrolase [Deltaproteobacteria bacterium]|nr:nucleoside triphosphate pyrophosphohydrolase [Deltaproteobacteria bacterium]